MKKRTLAAVQPIRPSPLRGRSVKTLDEIVSDVHAGRVTAFAIVAKSDGYSRWYTWSAKSTSDAVNILGQLEAIKANVAEVVNED